MNSTQSISHKLNLLPELSTTHGERSKFKAVLIGTALFGGLAVAAITHIALTAFTVLYFSIGLAYSAKLSLFVIPLPIILLTHLYVNYLPNIVTEAFNSMQWHWDSNK